MQPVWHIQHVLTMVMVCTNMSVYERKVGPLSGFELRYKATLLKRALVGI